MKIKTHNIFTIGILTAVGAFLTMPVFSFLFASFIAIISNQLIDTFGHKDKKINYIKPDGTKGVIIKPVRTPLTHTLFHSILWGLIPSLIALLCFHILLKHTPAFKNINPRNIVILIFLQGILSGPLHLLLDYITEGGIFVKKKGRYVRTALAHIKYNDPIWNIFFQFIGVLFVAATVLIAFKGHVNIGQLYRKF